MDTNNKMVKKHQFSKMSWTEIDKLDNEVINKIVSKMETLLKTPEEELVKQNKKPTDEDCLFYLIAKGRCQVMVTDKFKERSEDKIVRVLQPGDHFGEISMIFNCQRSATVKAEDYCTCATLNKAAYQDI
jgi:CRP-like cAMP-binding protein|tara:strand:+ start:55 stop:444 length:390 start_codon:yes stop_codon:yes gene_type:complete